MVLGGSHSLGCQGYLPNSLVAPLIFTRHLPHTHLYATSVFPIMHLICPSPPHPSLKFCITFVFHFSRVLQPSQEKLKTMFMKNLGEQRWVEMASDTLTLPSCLLPREDPSKSSSYSCSLLFLGDCSTKVCSSNSLEWSRSAGGSSKLAVSPALLSGRVSSRRLAISESCSFAPSPNYQENRSHFKLQNFCPGYWSTM